MMRTEAVTIQHQTVNLWICSVSDSESESDSGTSTDGEAECDDEEHSQRPGSVEVKQGENELDDGGTSNKTGDGWTFENEAVAKVLFLSIHNEIWGWVEFDLCLFGWFVQKAWLRRKQKFRPKKKRSNSAQSRLNRFNKAKTTQGMRPPRKRKGRQLSVYFWFQWPRCIPYVMTRRKAKDKGQGKPKYVKFGCP